MIDVVIFSKDRACQLDLCIRTIKEKFKGYNTIIAQYTYSTQQFKFGYDKLIKDHQDVLFINEDGFKDTFVDILSRNVTTKYFLVLVDDDVFINDVSEQEIQNLISIYESDNKIHTISLRMNPQVDYCFPARKPIRRPQDFSIDDNIMKWNWTQADTNYCWGYPHAIDSHLYELSRIKSVFEKENYTYPNNLEVAMLSNTDRSKPYMISPTQSKIFSIQNNFVKQGATEKSVNSAESLNTEFLEGKRISTNSIYGHTDTKVHGNIEYNLV